jgi:uncharacterized protein with PIN domain
LTDSLSFRDELYRLNHPKQENNYEVYSDDSGEEENQNCTCDGNNLKGRIVYEYFVVKEQKDYKKQILEIVNQFKIICKNEVFTRCLQCNICVDHIELTDENRVQLLKEPGVTEKVFLEYGKTFTRCPQCLRLFWRGHYYHKVLKLANIYSYHPEREEEKEEEELYSPSKKGELCLSTIEDTDSNKEY